LARGWQRGLFVATWSGTPRDLHPFPTRRSSDLPQGGSSQTGRAGTETHTGAGGAEGRPRVRLAARPPHGEGCRHRGRPYSRHGRSEEHTSELQSRENLVCRLLLEKKNELVSTDG